MRRVSVNKIENRSKNNVMLQECPTVKEGRCQENSQESGTISYTGELRDKMKHI